MRWFALVIACVLATPAAAETFEKKPPAPHKGFHINGMQGTGFTVQVLVNGTQVFEQRGSVGKSFSVRDSAKYLKAGKNKIQLKVTPKFEPNTYYKKRFSVYVHHTDDGSEPSISSESTRLVSIILEEADLTAGTRDYEFELVK